jgi:hypothetical protein
MLTTRNIFIANLAVSDIFLCAFTMPLTLVDLITKYWTLGPDQVQTKKLTRPPMNKQKTWHLKQQCFGSALV